MFALAMFSPHDCDLPRLQLQGCWHIRNSLDETYWKRFVVLIKIPSFASPLRNDSPTIILIIPHIRVYMYTPKSTQHLEALLEWDRFPLGSGSFLHGCNRKLGL